MVCNYRAELILRNWLLFSHLGWSSGASEQLNQTGREDGSIWNDGLWHTAISLFISPLPLVPHTLCPSSQLFVFELFLASHPPLSLSLQPPGAVWTGTKHEDTKLYTKTPGHSPLPPSLRPLAFHLLSRIPPFLVSTCLHSAEKRCRLQ